MTEYQGFDPTKYETVAEWEQDCRAHGHDPYAVGWVESVDEFLDSRRLPVHQPLSNIYHRVDEDGVLRTYDLDDPRNQ